MKKYILILITSIVAIQVSAQDIRGKVVDNNNSPLVGANVLLLTKVDSIYILQEQSLTMKAILYCHPKRTVVFLCSHILDTIRCITL